MTFQRRVRSNLDLMWVIGYSSGSELDVLGLKHVYIEAPGCVFVQAETLSIRLLKGNRKRASNSIMEARMIQNLSESVFLSGDSAGGVQGQGRSRSRSPRRGEEVEAR